MLISLCNYDVWLWVTQLQGTDGMFYGKAMSGSREAHPNEAELLFLFCSKVPRGLAMVPECSLKNRKKLMELVSTYNHHIEF